MGAMFKKSQMFFGLKKLFIYTYFLILTTMRELFEESQRNY